jgi:hypothetical protein
MQHARGRFIFIGDKAILPTQEVPLLLPLTDALRKLIPASIEVTDDMTNGKRLFKRLPPVVLLEGLLALA